MGHGNISQSPHPRRSNSSLTIRRSPRNDAHDDDVLRRGLDLDRHPGNQFIAPNPILRQRDDETWIFVAALRHDATITFVGLHDIL